MSCIEIINNHNDHKQVTIQTDKSKLSIVFNGFYHCSAKMDTENYDVCEKIINDIDAVFTKDPNL